MMRSSMLRLARRDYFIPPRQMSRSFGRRKLFPGVSLVRRCSLTARCGVRFVEDGLAVEQVDEADQQFGVAAFE